MTHAATSHLDDLIRRLERAATQGSAALRDAVAAAMAQTLLGQGPRVVGLGEVLGALMHAVAAAASKDATLDTNTLTEQALVGVDRIILQTLAAQQATQQAARSHRSDPPAGSGLTARIGEFEDAVMALMQRTAAAADRSPAGGATLQASPTVQVTLKNAQTAMRHARGAAWSAGGTLSQAESALADDLLGGMARALRQHPDLATAAAP